MSNLAWLFVALAIVIATIGGYTAALVTRERRLSARLRELEGRPSAGS